GLKIYAGHYETDKVAAPWIPQAEFSTDGKTVDELFLWAALDCPGAYSIPNKGHQPVVLGQMAMKFFQAVLIEQPHVITGWTIAIDGRKVKAGTAIFTANQELCAVAEQTWIILK
ncbi:MAG: hotdog fold domain-containing protein, partial [Saprospiraceae bacterium]